MKSMGSGWETLKIQLALKGLMNVPFVIHSGALGAGSFILIASYCSRATAAVVFMCIGVAASGLTHSGYTVNMLDIASNYACVIMGLSNTFGTIPGFLSPMLVGFITVNKVNTMEYFCNF